MGDGYKPNKHFGYLEVANWNGLRYTLMKTINPDRFVIKVIDDEEPGAHNIYLCEEPFSITDSNRHILSANRQSEAKNFIKESKEDFLAYWEDIVEQS